MIITTLVPREHVKDIWSRVASMVESALDHSNGRYELVDVYTDLLKGDQTLWVVASKDKEKIEMLGCCTVRVVQYPAFKALRFENMAGHDIQSWIWKSAETIQEYAQDIGCDRFECDGRSGWERVLAQKGWRKYMTSMELVFDKETE